MELGYPTYCVHLALAMAFIATVYAAVIRGWDCGIEVQRIHPPNSITAVNYGIIPLFIA